MQLPLEFTGEEMFGRYLDLHSLYHSFVNLTRRPAPKAAAAPAAAENGAAENDGDNGAANGAEPSTSAGGLDYMTYVQQFSHFHRTPASVKLGKGYREYVDELLAYLVSFHERTLPLKAVSKLLEGVESGFEAQWAGGEIVGWEDRAQGSLPEGQDLVLDPDVFRSAEELLEIGVRLPRAPVMSAFDGAAVAAPSPRSTVHLIVPSMSACHALPKVPPDLLLLPPSALVRQHKPGRYSTLF